MISIAKPVVEKEEMDAVMEVLKSGQLAQGKNVKLLEEQFAEFCGVKHAIAVSSGTAAIHASLAVLGIGSGDEVITTPFTFVATANPVIMQGAKVVFADIKEDTFNIDSEEIRKKVTDKTKAIIPVDLYGQPYDYDAVKKIADEHGLKIVEDACQAVGAKIDGRKAGTFGDLATFSFYATKNLITGEGGIITTDSAELAELCRRFRHHGQSEQTRYEYYELGYNYRMTDMQAAIGVCQLKRIEGFNQRRREVANMLTKGLNGVKGLRVPFVKQGVTHVFHQYTIIVDEDFPMSRDELKAALHERGVGSGVYYPKPLHLHPFYMKMGYKEGDFPVAEKLAKKVLSLPVHPLVSDEDAQKIVSAIKEISEEKND
ncbi:DegT/DnrJ/EryC1/StrS family aminotransferase [Candidatus Woesearchaeota archaeon]|nr:DegT/DnrJ/EryC1/StrS family aminotransferase [Candidatus Woesearchaeota archaeon]